MKFFYSFLLVVLLIPATIIAQEEEELEQENYQRKGGLVGGGGGVIPTWFLLNTNEINISLANAKMPQLSTSGFFLMGGGGYAYPGLIKNFRIGGVGAGGDMEESNTENGMYKSTKLSVSYGGVTLEYVIPIGDLHIALGGVIGWGSMTLTLFQTPNNSKSWDDIIGFNPAVIGTRHELTNNYFNYQPTLVVEYVLHPLITARIAGGYSGIAGKTWKMNDKFALTNVPDLKTGGGFIQIGLFLGAFLTN